MRCRHPRLSARAVAPLLHALLCSRKCNSSFVVVVIGCQASCKPTALRLTAIPVRVCVRVHVCGCVYVSLRARVLACGAQSGRDPAAAHGATARHNAHCRRSLHRFFGPQCALCAAAQHGLCASASPCLRPVGCLQIWPPPDTPWSRGSLIVASAPHY
jgi:hypothetical protein